MKKILFIAIAAAIIAGAIGAETMTLTVNQAVELAVTQNLGLKQSGIDLRTKERAKDTAWNAFLPSMNISAGFNGANQIFTDYGQAAPIIGQTSSLRFNTGIGISLPINAAVGTGIKQLVTDYEAGILDYEDAQKQLERDVRKQFYLLLGREENIRIQQANIDLAEKRLNQARNNFANGLAPELEVLSAEVTVANFQPSYDGAVADYESQLLFFKFLLGTDRNDKITLDGNLDTELFTLDSEKLINTYLPGRLDLRNLDKQIQAMEYSKSTVGRNSNTPTLTLGYNYGYGGSNSDYKGTVVPWGDLNDNSEFSLSLNWKFDGLIPGSETDVQLKELQDGIDNMNLGKQIALDNAGIEITNYVNKLATSRRTIEANTSSVELARRNYELTEEAYNVGTRELLDVESAQNDYLAAAQQLLLAKYEYIAGLLDLEYALNAPMDEFLNQ